MKTYTLIMLPEPIIVSDEDQQKGDNIIHKTLLDKITTVPDNISSTQEHWYKVLGKADFSSLSEEECKRIGWVDVEKYNPYQKVINQLASECEDIKFLANRRDGFYEGFKAAQSFNEKRYSEEDLRKAFQAGARRGYCQRSIMANVGATCNEPDEDNYIQSLQQPKSFEVEIEMEIIGQCDCECHEPNVMMRHVAPCCCPTLQPKLTKEGKIKILKVL
jgi:hypothetical protein